MELSGVVRVVVQGAGLTCVSQGVGSSSCCSRGCCCSGPGEEAKCPSRFWRWLELLGISRCTRAQVHQSSVRRRRRQHQDDGIQKRVDRAHNLVQLGELSAARQALEGANVAPVNLATLRALTNQVRRPPVARQELGQEILRSEPAEPFELVGDALLVCFMTARRGAAPGPSGMTADHLFPILERGWFGDVRASRFKIGRW